MYFRFLAVLVLFIGVAVWDANAQSPFPLTVKGKAIFDNQGNNLDTEQLMSLSEYGFDYSVYKRHKNYIIAGYIVSLSPTPFLIAVQFVNMDRRQKNIMSICLGAVAVLGAGILEYHETKLERYVKAINAKVDLSGTDDGFGLVVRF